LSFAKNLVRWQKASGRHGLPWQQSREAYKVWLSEIMLQQTQVATVIGYYERFLARFPTVQSLAAANEAEVLALWSGLGYYSRARNLHHAAITVVERFGGQFPSEPMLLAELKGVGRSTAAAIAAFSFGKRAAILDGNVKRVLCRHFAIDATPGAARDKALWALAESLLPDAEIEAYTQGLMDLGSGICTPKKPVCGDCPMRSTCKAYSLGTPEAFPAKAAKKARARRVDECIMLVLTCNNSIYLQERPSTGVWAKLWSFPQFPSAESAHGWLAGAGFGNKTPQKTPQMKHSFTHFDLQIEPWYIRCSPRRRRCLD
jgi:A/G-specific adenine glycosylase